MSLEILSYNPEFDSAIASLQTHLWSGDTARNAAYFRWKYLDNPFLDAVLLRLVRDESRIVAMRGLFGSLWELDEPGNRFVLPHADDFVVDPEYRNRGAAGWVMKETLADARARGFPFAVSLSASPVTFVSSLAAGWKAAGRYDPVWCHSPASAALQGLRDRLGSVRWLSRLRRFVNPIHIVNAGAPADPFAGLDSRAARMPPSVSLERCARPEEMAALVARLPWDGRIRHVRSREYFAWRFRNPLHDYRFLYFADDSGLRGYLVLQRSLSDRADRARVNVADGEADGDAVSAALLRAALDLGRFDRIQAWTTGVPDAARSLLRERGFAAPVANVHTRSGGLLVFRLGGGPAPAAWTLGCRNLLDIADWDLRMLYSMIA